MESKTAQNCRKTCSITPMHDAHLIITGFVQGVGYRKFVKHEAVKLGLTGWVRNLPDGSVEALVQGEKEKIEILIGKCRKGPFLSEVEKVDVVWEDKKEIFSDFSIRHDFS